MHFKDRFQAGKQLGEKLMKYKGRDVIILAIPRGGLQIGFEVAKALQAPLDIVLTKKIPFPNQPEVAIGAVGRGEVTLNKDIIQQHKIPTTYINEQVKILKKALNDKYKKYRGDQKPVSLKDKTVIIVDDGIAMGSTMIAAIHTVKKLNPKKIIAAFPVGSTDGVKKIGYEANETICLEVPAMFFAIGNFYDDFSQVEDKEAIKLLKEANK